ncbi:MAG: hypothetical protein LBU53_03340 [Zoogloeaceae bacterium]|nr:hypothetical protein [Zoogloeaceae bacterium]
MQQLVPERTDSLVDAGDAVTEQVDFLSLGCACYTGRFAYTRPTFGDDDGRFMTKIMKIIFNRLVKYAD